MLQKIDYFNFTGLHRPVAFINSESLYPHLLAILRDWKVERVGSHAEKPPVITVLKTGAGFQRTSWWLSKPAVFRSPIDAVCDMIVDLIHAYVAENAGLLCLHCAAVEFKRGLVVFPNTYRAGKSILSLKLVSCNARLFTDDVLPVTNRRNFGVALGILPRLRLPLPEGLERKLVDFISNRAGPRNTRYLYAELSPDEQAVLGTTAPIRGIVILQHEKDVKPALEKVKKNIVIKDMILRNFARRNPAIDIVDRLYSVVENAECYKLRYAGLDQAVELLEHTFGLPGD